jgi:galactokinase
MDQMASSLADARTALFLDTRDLTFERIPLPLDAADLVVIHSGVTHVHAGGEYNARRAACEQACQLLGVPQLRDLTLADLPRLAQLPSPLDRRARHVVTENDRTVRAAEAMSRGDARELGALMYASHASLRDDYEVSTPELNLLVRLAQADPDVFGARLTGGGFGGAVVLLTHHRTGHAVGQRLTRQYAAQSGRTPTLLVPTAE